MVEEEVGEAHHVAAPGEGDGEHRHHKQTPGQRALHQQQPQHEEHADEGADIDGTRGAGLLAPILPQLLIEGHVVALGQRHGFLAARQGHGGAALGVGHQERPGLADAVAPHGDVTALQSAGGLVGGVFAHVRQLRLAAHALAGVFPGVVEVADVHHDAQNAARSEGERPPEPAPEGGPSFGGFPEERLQEPGQRQRGDDEAEVVAHLHVVAQDLQAHEERRDDRAPGVAPAVAERHAADGGRDEGQREHLPDVARADDDEVVAGEGPQDGAQRSHPPAEVEAAHHDVEAQEQDEDPGGHVGQTEHIDLLHGGQRVGRVVGGRHLIGGHAREEGVGPAGAGPVVRLAVELHLLSGPHAARVVVSAQDEAVPEGHHEVEHADRHKDRHGGGIAQIFFHRSSLFGCKISKKTHKS